MTVPQLIDFMVDFSLNGLRGGKAYQKIIGVKVGLIKKEKS